MSSSFLSASDVHGVIPQSNFGDRGGVFVRALADHLKLELVERDGSTRLRLGESDRAAFAGQSEIELDVSEAEAGNTSGESLRWDGRFGQWIAERARSSGPALHARPRGEPMSVHDIMSQMFAAYEVEGGNTHLAGCELTDHPFLRLTFAAEDQCAVRHVFVAPDGSSVSDDLIARLGLNSVAPVVDAPPRLEPAALRSLAAAGRRIAAKQSTDRDPDAAVAEPLAVTVIWIRHADGHLQFTIGEASATLGFSGWAKLLTPPPFVAPGSGANTFHLAATDDGRIDAVDELATCQQSGRRVLRAELVRCNVTGQMVLPEFTETCSVTGLPALRSEFQGCPLCRQRVSKAALESAADGLGHCEACRQMSRIRKDDPRLVWLLGEHPGLDRWRRWQLAETETVYITQASSLTKKILIVADKETLSVRFLATGGLIHSGWAEAPEGVREELLR
ncbi:hypothetical protein OAS39_10750 [Pirellulales bacterium]|nr:hypothetical protein [Pirellulales bacterium]